LERKSHFFDDDSVTTDHARLVIRLVRHNLPKKSGELDDGGGRVAGQRFDDRIWSFRQPQVAQKEHLGRLKVRPAEDRVFEDRFLPVALLLAAVPLDAVSVGFVAVFAAQGLLLQQQLLKDVLDERLFSCGNG
jgi:hypothetical protein